MIDRFEGHYAPLSNFTGTIPVTAEAVFQAFKTVNPLAALDVLFASSPGEAKRRGNSVVLRPGWDEHLRVPVMKRVLVAKFAREPHRSLLLSTGDVELVEGNRHHDTFWGVCVCPRCGGVGENMLGKLLMEVRSEL